MTELTPDWPPHFRKYGIHLCPVTDADLELIRGWRNDQEINQHMLDQSYITQQMQQAWFKRLQGDTSQVYWLIMFKDEKIGVASLTNIDREKGTAEPGMYIFTEKYKNNIVPFCAAFALNDFAFEQLGSQQLKGKIFDNNGASLRFHQSCGYVQVGEAEAGLLHFVLTADQYIPARDKISHFIRY
ncbi:GNAT family N-acetyltransferase [uncultured Paraglaciecola sp.]|uniref:GNAT family N-acetyltransferase n=1 Tax=uncultured Paraglaciecola sp. TaxID=1765024 RepID=UPI0026042B1D|nr:GNAT family N-acetyltransferase [uncultured Paraglaciecola sp.]